MSDSRLTIVHVAAPGPFGGLESVVALLTAGLTRRRHHVRVALVLDLEPVPHLFEQRLDELGVEVVPIRLAHRAYLRERSALRELLRATQPDVVHTHGYRADVQAAAVARGLGIPTASTVHGFTGGDWKNQVFEWLQMRSLARADAVVCVSRPQVDRLRAAGVAASGIHLLPNAWGSRPGGLSRELARRELGLSAERFVVGWVGRLSIEKGADVLLEALARSRDPSLSACVIGDGPERAALVERAQRLGVHDQVHWAGARPDAGRLFAAFDGFALSSRTEGVPMVLFEAMDAGVPVVATAVGGVPDIVGPEHATLVPAEDPEALAQALAAIRSDRDEAARRAERARAHLAERFGLEPWLAGYESIYRGIAVATAARKPA